MIVTKYFLSFSLPCHEQSWPICAGWILLSHSAKEFPQPPHHYALSPVHVRPAGPHTSHHPTLLSSPLLHTPSWHPQYSLSPKLSLPVPACVRCPPPPPPPPCRINDCRPGHHQPRHHSHITIRSSRAEGSFFLDTESTSREGEGERGKKKVRELGNGDFLSGDDDQVHGVRQDGVPGRQAHRRQQGLPQGLLPVPPLQGHPQGMHQWLGTWGSGGFLDTAQPAHFMLSERVVFCELSLEFFLLWGMVKEVKWHKKLTRICIVMMLPLQLANYNSFEGVLYCRPHFDQLFKRTGSLDKSFEGTEVTHLPGSFLWNYRMILWFLSLTSIYPHLQWFRNSKGCQARKNSWEWGMESLKIYPE